MGEEISYDSQTASQISETPTYLYPHPHLPVPTRSTTEIRVEDVGADVKEIQKLCRDLTSSCEQMLRECNVIIARLKGNVALLEKASAREILPMQDRLVEQNVDHGGDVRLYHEEE